MVIKKPHIALYTDYRLYLRDKFAYHKQIDPEFSFRKFSSSAGYSSPNFLQLVILGKRDISDKSVLKIGHAFGLAAEEMKIFSSLVRVNQAQTIAHKVQELKSLFKDKQFSRARRLERKQFAYYDKWYHTAIRELVCVSDFKEDAAWISRKLRNKIAPRQVSSSIKLLLNLGMLKRNNAGKLVQANPTIESGEELQSLAIKNFHRQMIDQAKLSLDEQDVSQRDISSLTLGVPKALMPEFKRRIRAFRNELLNSIGSSTHSCDEIIQLNMQIFSLTTNEKES